jgi:hypothetical protein
LEFSNLGWNYFYVNRFNLAWLIDSTNASAYFGFYTVNSIFETNPKDYFKTFLLDINKVMDPKQFYNIWQEKDSANYYDFQEIRYIMNL